MNNEKTNLEESLEEEIMLEESQKTFEGTPSATTTDVPSFGWSNYAERINGRFAMIGFIFILFIELLSNKGFLFWSGFLN